ncbi:MAG: hypothetical protein EXR35_11360 [Limnohabitans sp.]|nr:hypothetical protein [Limnohabitans sp.]
MNNKPSPIESDLKTKKSSSWDLWTEKMSVHEVWDRMRVLKLQEVEQKTRPAARMYSGVRMMKA